MSETNRTKDERATTPGRGQAVLELIQALQEWMNAGGNAGGSVRAVAFSIEDLIDAHIELAKEFKP